MSERISHHDKECCGLDDDNHKGQCRNLDGKPIERRVGEQRIDQRRKHGSNSAYHRKGCTAPISALHCMHCNERFGTADRRQRQRRGASHPCQCGKSHASWSDYMQAHGREEYGLPAVDERRGASQVGYRCVNCKAEYLGAHPIKCTACIWCSEFAEFPYPYPPSGEGIKKFVGIGASSAESAEETQEIQRIEGSLDSMSTQPENELTTQKPAEGPRRIKLQVCTECGGFVENYLCSSACHWDGDYERPSSSCKEIEFTESPPAAPSPSVAPPIEARGWLKSPIPMKVLMEGIGEDDGEEIWTDAEVCELLTAYYAACRSKEEK